MTAHKPLGLDGDTLFDAVIATAVDGIIVIDENGIIQVYNAACELLFGYSRADVLGQNVKMLAQAPHDEDRDGHLPNFGGIGAGQIIGAGCEVEGRRKNGSVFPMYLSIGEGTLSGAPLYVGIIRDLSAVKAQAALRDDADRHLAQIVQSSNDAILSKTLDGIITSWNDTAELIFGYSAGEAIGQSIAILVPPDRLMEEARSLEQLRAGYIEHYETVRKHKTGRDIFMSLSISPIRDGAGSIVGASTIARDITEKKEAEARTKVLLAELAHVARLSAMGQMTAAIAHELNQPLTAITNYVTAARRTLAAVEETSAPLTRAQGMLEKAAEQTLRAGGIIQNLRDFVAKRESGRTPENLNKIVEEALALCFFGATDGNVKVHMDLDPALPAVMINKIQIEQVLINLIRNSIEAMAGMKRPELSLSTGRDGEGCAHVTVADTGPGLPPDIAARLFQPFMTTKDSGLGIGLTICQSIVQAHEGRIWSLPGRTVGTAFCVRLPVAKPAQAAA
jgi:two-component system, LuxR family, sensor kinase FixL